MLNVFAHAEHDRVQRIAGQVDRHPGLFAQPLIEAAQQRTDGRARHETSEKAGKIARAWGNFTGRELMRGQSRSPGRMGPGGELAGGDLRA